MNSFYHYCFPFASFLGRDPWPQGIEIVPVFFIQIIFSLFIMFESVFFSLYCDFSIRCWSFWLPLSSYFHDNSITFFFSNFDFMEFWLLFDVIHQYFYCILDSSFLPFSHNLFISPLIDVFYTRNIFLCNISLFFFPPTTIGKRGRFHFRKAVPI